MVSIYIEQRTTINFVSLPWKLDNPYYHNYPLALRIHNDLQNFRISSFGIGCWIRWASCMKWVLCILNGSISLGTSVTSHGLQCLLRKLSQVGSLGEYTISDSFLRSLCVVSSLNMDKFTLRNLHARKISDAGMYNMVHVFPYVEHFTCWEPAFDLSDLIYFCHLKQLTLLRVVFTETVFQQLLKFFRTSQTYYLHAVQGLTTTGSNFCLSRFNAKTIFFSFM